MKLKERVQRFIADLGISKSEFSRKIGCDRSYLYKWLKDQADMSQAKLDKIEKYISRFGY